MIEMIEFIPEYAFRSHRLDNNPLCSKVHWIHNVTNVRDYELIHGFSIPSVDIFEYLFSDKRMFYPVELIDFLSEHRSEFVTLTFPDERLRFWTNEELRNFLFDPHLVLDIVYYSLSNDDSFCILFRTRYGSRPVYVEIIYIKETRQATRTRAWWRRRAEVGFLQSSIIVTYSVRRFLDYIVSNYDGKDAYSSNWPDERGDYEKWEVEDRDFIFENVLVCRAIERNDIDDIKRSWSRQEQREQQPPSLQQLCGKLFDAKRDRLWNDSTLAAMPALVGVEIGTLIIKNRRERRVLLSEYMKKIFVNIIPSFGCKGLKEDEDIYRSSFDFDCYSEHNGYQFCCTYIHEYNFVFKYLAHRYSKSYTFSQNIHIEPIYLELLHVKKELEMKYYPGICFPSLD